MATKVNTLSRRKIINFRLSQIIYSQNQKNSISYTEFENIKRIQQIQLIRLKKKTTNQLKLHNPNWH